MAKLGNCLMALGAALVICALGLYVCNWKEAYDAEYYASKSLLSLQNQMETEKAQSEQETEETIPLPAIYLDEKDFVMKEIEIDGRLYIGYLSIPCLDLELPILSAWDYESLQIAPCRYYGTVKGENLVLMAHNYAKHFGRLSDLKEGDSVIFVDADGNVIEYAVTAKDVLPPEATEEMISGNYDLTLFTCTYGGAQRVTVFCDKKTAQ